MFRHDWHKVAHSKWVHKIHIYIYLIYRLELEHFQTEALGLLFAGAKNFEFTRYVFLTLLNFARPI